MSGSIGGIPEFLNQYTEPIQNNKDNKDNNDDEDDEDNEGNDEISCYNILSVSVTKKKYIDTTNILLKFK